MRSFKYYAAIFFGKFIINFHSACCIVSCVQALHSGAMKSIANTSSAENKRYNRFKNICPCMSSVSDC